LVLRTGVEEPRRDVAVVTDREQVELLAPRALDHFADEVLGRLTRVPRLVILGFSQGAVMAARWLAQGRVAPDAVMLWGAPLPSDVAMPDLALRLAGRPLHLFAGDADPFVPARAIEASAEAMRAAGINAQATRFPGGHAIPGSALLQAAGRDS